METPDQPSSLQSICHVRASELYPKANMQTEDKRLNVPFTPVCGESPEFLGHASEGVLALSNYRLYLQLKDTFYNIPLGLIELLEVRDIFFLHIGCKDARSLRCTFSTNEHCLEWYHRLHKAISPPKTIDSFFAFAFFTWAAEEGGEDVIVRLGPMQTTCYNSFKSEVERLKFDVNGAWRISTANYEYSLCPSYPRQLLVPACITDETLESAARFRSARRVPAVVWRHTGNGAVIARCSQPEVGWLGWRSSEDEDLIKAIADACMFDRGRSTMMDGNTPTSLQKEGIEAAEVSRKENKKVLIMDARSYTTAVANRARGGGCECPEYYPSCDIQFMNLANIHSIRKSFHAVRQLCSTTADQPNWYSLLEGTRWLQHMAGLLRAAVTVVSAVEREGRPVLVHCSDGWDRTPQIVALAEVLLDPYYRTVEGFQVLCEREWLDFGHKFADRCGHCVGVDDLNERCPVFLQWLDCIHQLLVQFPCSFQFSSSYLVKLAQHTYSNLFGTFLCNTAQERSTHRVYERTFSVWRFLRGSCFRNHLYTRKDQVLWPSCNVRDLVLWREVYLGSVEIMASSLNSDIPVNESTEDKIPANNVGSSPTIVKTRSYGDLVAAAADHSTGGSHRRLSDPNIALDIVIKFDALNARSDDCPKPERFSATECNGTQPLPVLMNGELGDEDSDSTSDPGFIDAPRLAFDDEEDNEESVTDSKSEVTVLTNGLTPISVDSSTDTLVASDITRGQEEPTEVCRMCHTGGSASSSTSGKTSRYSTPPLYSRTPSSGYPTTPSDDRSRYNAHRLDDVDGLAPVQNDIQSRLQQIIAEHKAKEESLQRELHTTRLALLHQVCHHCNHANDRADDVGSLPESVCSGEQPSAGESLPSDVSWENLEERDVGPTLWVPDHAVNRCMGCDTEFWLGRRKHHCRNCGKIFCYDCSENAIPLPSEQLYDPVRVCTSCFTRLHDSASTRHSHVIISENCKQANGLDHVSKCPKSAVTAAST